MLTKIQNLSFFEKMLDFWWLCVLKNSRHLGNVTVT